MLSNPTSPIAAPQVDSTARQSQTLNSAFYLRKVRLDGRLLSILAVTIGCLITGIEVSRQIYAHGGTLWLAVLVGLFTFGTPRLTLWLLARL